MQKTLLLLGAGELGLMLIRSAKKYGLRTVAVDAYADAPAMKEADKWYAVNFSNQEAICRIISSESPDFIIREIESISTDLLSKLENEGHRIYPNAESIKISSNKRKALDLANRQLKIKTPEYIVASGLDEVILATQRLGLPCVMKPVSSSSGLGLSVIRDTTEIEGAWLKTNKARRKHKKVLVEEYIAIDQELTILLVKQKNGETLICPPIGHTSKRGNFNSSWQPAIISDELLSEAESAAKKLVESIDGLGVWAIEFFISHGELFFNEICPKPHSTGLVTLAGSQTIDQFDLHIMAMLEIPIEPVYVQKAAACHALLTEAFGTKPKVSGMEKLSNLANTSVELFNKPITKPFRRMGVALSFSDDINDIENTRETVTKAAQEIEIS